MIAETDIIESASFHEMIRKAGKAIMNIYGSPFSVAEKSDRSPITSADRISNKIITAFLDQHYTFPVLSEEGKDIPYEKRQGWDAFWLVDPLDGTKEFMSRTGEFTVNIALIKRGAPVLAVIYVPVRDILYYAVRNGGAYRIERDMPLRLPLERRTQELTVVGSRSHATPATVEFLQKLRARHKKVSVITAGSSLKFCLVAEGTADLYPRLGPTMEWDTAAGQLIVEEAGGRVLVAADDNQLRYNKRDLKNPDFIAIGRSYGDYETK